MPACLRSAVVAVLAVLTPVRVVEAQTGTPAAPLAIRESVVVTATGRETPESKIGATVTVLESETIEQRHALSTIDLLRAVPGVVAVRTGGVGNLTGVFVRGGESTYNKVLLDGIPLNEPGGSFNFASLSPENIERIEVMRGAHSALFGSDAMASVIQLFSMRPEAGRPQARITADGGNYNTGPSGRGSSAARNNDLEYSRLRFVPGHRQSRAEQREHHVHRSWPSQPIVRIGRIYSRLIGRGRMGTNRRARSHGVRARRTWTRRSATMTAVSSAAGISRWARASPSRPATRTPSPISARQT